MKINFLLAACLLSLFIPLTVFAANVTKVVITAVEPMVGERQSYEASVPATASTEVYEVLWNGEFDNGVFVQGRDYVAFPFFEQSIIDWLINTLYCYSSCCSFR